MATSDLRLVRNSETSTWRECRLKWYLSYVMGFDGHGVNPAFWLGNLVHFALSEWYLGRSTDPAHLFWDLAEASLKELQEGTIALEGGEGYIENIEELTKWQRVGTAMVEGYQIWDAEHRDFDVIDSELSYFIDLETLNGRPFTFVGRLDLLAENSEGIRVHDFKTAADFRAARWTDQDSQFRRYPWMVRQAHPDWAEDVVGSMWIGLRKIEPSKRSKPPYFSRVAIDLTAAEYEQVGVELVAEVTEMLKVERYLTKHEGSAERQARVREVIYPTPTVDCTWRCEFFRNGLCQVYRSGRDPTEFGQNYGTWGNDNYKEYKLDIKGAVTT